MSRDCKPVSENLIKEVTVDCATAFEKLVGNRQKGEQAGISLGLKKPFEKGHHIRLKRRAGSHQRRSKATTDIAGLIN